MPNTASNDSIDNNITFISMTSTAYYLPQWNYIRYDSNNNTVMIVTLGEQ